jgi:hypothetical protein
MIKRDLVGLVSGIGVIVVAIVISIFTLITVQNVK